MVKLKLTETEKGKTADIMGTIQKEFVLAGQGVDSASYCDVSW
jgi:hypothetical protein